MRRLLWKREVHCRVLKNPLLDPVLNLTSIGRFSDSVQISVRSRDMLVLLRWDCRPQHQLQEAEWRCAALRTVVFYTPCMSQGLFRGMRRTFLNHHCNSLHFLYIVYPHYVVSTGRNWVLGTESRAFLWQTIEVLKSWVVGVIVSVTLQFDSINQYIFHMVCLAEFVRWWSHDQYFFCV